MTRFIIKKDTNIEGITMKTLLLHFLTKQELTIFLGKELSHHLECLGKRYVVVYDTTLQTNITELDEDLFEHLHEEADTLIILHALDVSSTSSFKELTISSPDTDVFLLLLYFYPQLCNVTLF
jgi:hypothetical protein